MRGRPWLGDLPWVLILFKLSGIIIINIFIEFVEVFLVIGVVIGVI
jgi:hypothetical protein